MRTVVEADLIEPSIGIRRILLDHRQNARSAGCVEPVKPGVVSNRVRTAADRAKMAEKLKA
jgi:hypothetical protein